VFRCFAGLPEGQTAVGSDYGLVVLKGESARPFPFPQGARHEMRDIQDLAWDGKWLHVVSAKNGYRWDLKDTVHTVAFPQDAAGGFEELRGVFNGPNGLIQAWRMRWILNDVSQPAEDILSMATNGVDVFYGSRTGILGVLGGKTCTRFEGPIRHLTWAHNRLWIAADKALWTLFPGEPATQIQRPEPYGLCTDPLGRMWCLGADGLAQSENGETPTARGHSIQRPWSIGANSVGLWVGQRGGLSRWLWASESNEG
jgi:hypothetical protein